MIVMRSYLTEKQRNVPVLFGKTEVLRGENAAMFSLGLLKNDINLAKISNERIRVFLSKFYSDPSIKSFDRNYSLKSAQSANQRLLAQLFVPLGFKTLKGRTSLKSSLLSKNSW